MISDHAKDRLKERCGLPKKAIERNVKTAFEQGIKHSECTGRLRKYLDYLFLSHKLATNIRLYGDTVYIFQDENLITVFQLPKIYKKAVNKLSLKKNKGV